MTISDRTPSSVRRRMPFRCVSAKIVFIRISMRRGRGIEPLIIRQPGIGMDIDHPIDLVTFLNMSPSVPTRTLAFLEQSGIAERILTAEQGPR
jgi:2-phospho-L-lactate/phosphoenolpyruvate guanylyltransferase